MRFICDGKKIRFGVCYYPEQWPEENWESDIRRMLDAGIETIRIGEFAWSKVEPREDEFSFEFFDRFLDLCDRLEMHVIFGTPTATPPAWLTEKYPEVLNCDINGVAYRHGSRRHYNYSSQLYCKKCRIIVEAIAKQYGKRKCIIGWQIDNELNCETSEFYSNSDTAAFRFWLLNKYHNIENLNEAWGATFWNQTYNEWDEIHVPRRTVNGAQNPHQMLDYYRFISDNVIHFTKEQVNILKEYKKPDDFITTNGMFAHIDNHALRDECLDIYMYDSYPNFNNRINNIPDDEDIRDRLWSKYLTEVRSINPIFGIMEQQTGANGWNIWPGVPNPRPGQIKLWTLQSIAHGADFVSYFRWRTATFGTEMYWHGILDCSGKDNERLAEVKDTISFVKELGSFAGKEYVSKVAVLKDYDNIFDAEIDAWHRGVNDVSEKALFETLQKTHTPFDYLFFYGNDSLSSDIRKYKVVFYPHPVIMTEERAKILKEYVKNGGIVIFGARSGQKNKNGHCVLDPLPGELRSLTGIELKEYSHIQPDYDKVMIDVEGETLRAEVFVDRIEESPAATVIGRYANEYYKGDIAITRKTVEKGYVYYYGSAFNEDSVKYFLKLTDSRAPFEKIVSVPKCVEIARRGDCLFLLNYSGQPVNVEFNETVNNLYSREAITGKYELQGYGVLVAKVI